MSLTGYIGSHTYTGNITASGWKYARIIIAPGDGPFARGNSTETVLPKQNHLSRLGE